MSFVDDAKGEINFKIAYHGPGLCGKSTNIQRMYDTFPGAKQGKLLNVATETDRLLSLDFVPLPADKVRGLTCRVALCTVAGPVFYDASRALALKGADGVVFVADSQQQRMEANVEAFVKLESILAINGLDPDAIPIVLQYNKRDLPTAVPVATMDGLLNPTDLERLEAVAYKGHGVIETFERIWSQVFARASAGAA